MSNKVGKWEDDRQTQLLFFIYNLWDDLSNISLSPPVYSFAFVYLTKQMQIAV